MKEFQINGNDWKCKFVRKTDESDSAGLCHFPDRLIVIKLGQGREETLKTFVHELLHAFEFEYGFLLNHDHIYKIEDAFLDFYKTNLVTRP